MKVAILAPSPVPFSQGGAEAVWRGLQREITESTPHDVELVKWPVREHSLPELMASYEAFAGVDLSHFDLVITGKYPAWMVDHPRHVVYMLHPLRGLYDTYASFGLPMSVPDDEPVVRRLLHAAKGLRERSQLPAFFGSWREVLRALGPDHPLLGFPGSLARVLVHALDALGLSRRSVQRHMAISRTVARRANYFPPGVRVDVVHPPSDLKGLHTGRADYFFTASRLDGPKRLDLLVRAMRLYHGSVPLKIAGTGPERAKLEAAAAADPRIELLGYVPADRLVGLYADALAVPFLPLDEDLGLITLEAMASGKPVITCTDSGGPTEFVTNDVTGLAVPPTPGALAGALTTLASDPGYAARLGRTAQLRAAEVTWERVTSTLLSTGPRGADRPRGRGKPKIVVTSTFELTPPRGGGQLRAVHLYGGLTEQFDVEAVCLASSATPPAVREIAPGFLERVVPMSGAHEAAEHAETRHVGMPITDIVAGRLVRLTPAYEEALKEASAGAVAAVLAHPFLHPAVQRVAPQLSVVYDAHNCEIDLKSSMLPPGRHGDRMRELVRQVEGDAVRAARLVATVSTEDAEALVRAYGRSSAPVVVVPNGVDVAGTPFVEGDERRRNRARYIARMVAAGAVDSVDRIALFVGSWHMPNIEAGRSLLHVAEQLPTVLFALVGGHGRGMQGVSLPSNVVLLDVVGDSTKRLLLRSSDVALNPVVTGSGTNLKLVEYAAAGIPVVSTPTGARGLDFRPGSLLLAEPSQFASAIATVLADDAAADAAAASARSDVELAYDWRAISAELLKAVREAVSV